MKDFARLFLSLIGLLALSLPAAEQAPTVVRTINSANPEPQLYNWHPHNRLGIERATFVGVKTFNRVQLREETGDVVEVPFFHFTARDLGELMNKMARFPAETKVIDYAPGPKPLVEIRPSELQPGPLEKMPNHGVLGGHFHSMNRPPVVEDILGRRAVHFDCNLWFYDTQWTAMVLDAMPAKALRDGEPFTLSTWVLHPRDQDWDDAEMLVSWHGRGGNNGTGLDWKRATCRGDFYVMGLGGDLWIEPEKRAKPMKEWTHVAYVYTGGGLNGELRIYENGKLVATGKSKFVPEFREPQQITANSVVLKGNLNTVAPDQLAYVRGYVGEYDAHHFGQLRHIGRWDQMNEIGLKGRGEFEIPFKGLKPGTLYYYRMFATEDPTSYENPGEPTRRWANGAGRFITATADGKPGQILPLDTDRYIFLGCQWGSRWYSSFSGPAGLFRGYISDLKLYDRVLSDDEIRKDASATAASDPQPADGSRMDVDKASFAWKTGVSTAAAFNFYLDTDRAKIENGTAQPQKLTAAEIKDVKLRPGLTHYWRVDALDDAGKVLAKGNVWQLKVTCGEPSKPRPEDGSRWSRTGCFGWVQTIGTHKEQRFYFGSSMEEVAKATKPLQKFDGNRRDCSIPAGQLDFGKTYYWRVESTTADGQVVPGPVWSFTVYDYFTPEWDGPASEPYPAAINPPRASKLMAPAVHPTISTPRADEAGMRDVAHATKRFLYKSRQMREMLAAHPCATTLSSHEGPPCVEGFVCGSYGGLPGWNLTMHEMGHQIHGALIKMEPSFLRLQNEVFNSHADNNAWLGDYASANLWENMAVNGQGFISAVNRDMALVEDAPMYHLLAKYLPGDLCIDLHPSSGLAVAADNRVLRWENRGGAEGIVPGQQNYDRIPETIGTFLPAGAPRMTSVAGVPAIAFRGADGFLWDRGLKYGFEKNRAWSVELWAYRDAAGTADEVLLAWGPEAKGVRLFWGGSAKTWSLCGKTADWPAKPAPGRWHHIVFLFEGGGLADGEGAMRLFLNGKEVLKKSCKLDLAANSPVHIAGIVEDGKVTGGFNGALGQIRVYNYAMSVDQVTEHCVLERSAHERTMVPHIGGQLYVDLDATGLWESGSEEHNPLYPASLCKPWVRSWANKGSLAGRIHNDVSTQWHYSGSTPLYRETACLQSLRFMGKDRMIGTMDVRGTLTDKLAATLEAVVYSEAASPDEVVLEWGNFVLDARYLKPGWQHVAAVSTGGNSIVYINGEKAGEIPGCIKPSALDHLHLGAHFDPRRENWYRYFNGAIAQVRVHELALTPEQLAENARCSPALTAYAPSPSDGARVVAERKPALSWKSAGADAQAVLFGEDPTALASAGNFKSGEFKPELKGGKRYFWRVGRGPVWSFETALGELVNLSAETLAQGPLSAWKNAGQAGGQFAPADRGNLLGMDVDSFLGKNGLRLVRGKTLTFRPEGKTADALAKGPWTIALHVASDSWTESAPVMSWGKKDQEARLWFGTASNDRRLLTMGQMKNVNENHPANQLKLIYPEGCNARMAFAWKTIAVTYAEGEAQMWYNTRLIQTRKTDLSMPEVGELVLGWTADKSNANVLLNDLRVYDRVLKAAEIEQLVKTGSLAGTPVVWVSVEGLKPESRVAEVPNRGAIQGRFTSEPEVNRAPKVAQVSGRNAVVFDGVAMMTSDILLPEALTDARPFTVEMWALQDEPSKDSRLLAFSQETSERWTAFGMGSPADRKALVRPISNAEWNITGDEKPKQWVHLAYVYDGGIQSTVRLYRNGKLNGEHPFKTINTLGGYPMSIGGAMSPSKAETALFRGAIAQIRIFDYPRTAEEIGGAAAKAP